MTATETVFEAVRDVAFGEAVTFENLTLLPLIAAHERDAEYRVLDEARARGWVEITEASESGHVPELKVVNRGETGVLLLDGEELLGAKQNRVLNLTILVPPHHSSAIPVSCVESGPILGAMAMKNLALVLMRTIVFVACRVCRPPQ